MVLSAFLGTCNYMYLPFGKYIITGFPLCDMTAD